MPDLQQALVVGEALRVRLRGGGTLLASALAHTGILLSVLLYGSPKLLATASPDPIVVDIVSPEEISRPEEISFGTSAQSPGPARQEQPQPAQQQPAQQPQPQQQPAPQPPRQEAKQPQPPRQQANPSQAQRQQPAPAQEQPQPAAASPSLAASPVFTSLYPWPVAHPPTDTQPGDYRTFESMEKLQSAELVEFKARLKECWKPPAVHAGAGKLRAALRVALRVDGSLAAAPELVEVSASPDALALVTSAKQAINQCGPYGFLSAETYDTWKSLSLTFSPDDVAIAVVMK